MPFDLTTWWTITRLVLTEDARPKRLAVQLVLLSLLTAWAAFTSVWLWLDRWMEGSHESPPPRAPVFIVGNARSGTTMLHRLLCEDTSRFFHFQAWEISCPSLMQKRALRALAHFGERWLFGAPNRLIRRIEQWALGTVDRRHATGLTAPEEDEFLLLAPFASPVLNVLFPFTRQLGHLERFDAWPRARRQAVMAYYRRCVQRQAQFVDAQQRVLLSKNPAFVLKLRSLLETFPDARFVYLVRDPTQTLPSLLDMLSEVWADLDLSPQRIADSRKALVDGGIHSYEYAHAVLRTLPPSQVATVRFDDLITHPRQTVQQIYDTFGMTVCPRFDATLVAADLQARDTRSEPRTYDAQALGVDLEDLTRRLAPIIEEVGLHPMDSGSSDSRDHRAPPPRARRTAASAGA
ncbi:MAG: sulfotransferase [Myxococcales bacterium]|nr:sulfotransferase [Myxococcales bacterium]